MLPAPMQSTHHPALASLNTALGALTAPDSLGPETIETIYRTGYSLFQQGKHEEAGSFFTFLHLYFPTEARYLKALGACHRACGRLAHALQAYDMILMSDPYDAEASLKGAECMVASGNLGDAKVTLAALIRLLKAGNGDEHQAIRAKAEGLLALLETREFQ